MPKYAYQALDAKGRAVHGEMEAPNVEAVVEDLRRVRYTVTNVTEKVDVFSPVMRWMDAQRRVNPWALVVFTRQFATLFNSGVPLLRAVEGLVGQSLSPVLGDALQRVHSDVKGGVSLANALQKHPRVFTPIYVNLIRAGEKSGALGEILDRTATYLERDYQVRKRVQAALSYPVLVFAISLAVVAVLMMYVVPKFIDLIQGLSADVPWPTQVLIWITNAVQSWKIMLLALCGGVAGAIALKKYVDTKEGRKRLDRFKLYMPLFGVVNQKVLIARFCRTLSTLLTSGVPALNALDIVSKVADNEVLVSIIEDIKQGIRAGLRMSQPLQDYDLFPPVVSQMAAVGEETGHISDIFSRLATFYEAEIEATVDSIATLIEPIMIMGLGCVVGFIVIAVFLPVYQIIGNFAK